jgi:cytidylate kinase
MSITVTIARQLGSGGSYAGKRIAAALGFHYLDREVLQLTARALHREEQEMERREERLVPFWERVIDAFGASTPDAGYAPPPFLPISDSDIFQKETEIMNTVAAHTDCVIIGRAAAHALTPHDGLINLLLHAPVDFRVGRVQELYHVSDEKQARLMIAQSDEMRRKYTAQMTGREWLGAANYHLALDTSLLPLDEMAELLVDYIRRRIARAH